MGLTASNRAYRRSRKIDGGIALEIKGDGRRLAGKLAARFIIGGSGSGGIKWMRMTR